MFIWMNHTSFIIHDHRKHQTQLFLQSSILEEAVKGLTATLLLIILNER